jgi:hypothetical protein
LVRAWVGARGLRRARWTQQRNVPARLHCTWHERSGMTRTRGRTQTLPQPHTHPGNTRMHAHTRMSRIARIYVSTYNYPCIPVPTPPIPTLSNSSCSSTSGSRDRPDSSPSFSTAACSTWQFQGVRGGDDVRREWGAPHRWGIHLFCSNFSVKQRERMRMDLAAVRVSKAGEGAAAGQ